jgi:hypothetical protein
MNATRNLSSGFASASIASIAIRAVFVASVSFFAFRIVGAILSVSA